jgi:hypothetical protein
MIDFLLSIEVKLVDVGFQFADPVIQAIVLYFDQSNIFISLEKGFFDKG